MVDADQTGRFDRTAQRTAGTMVGEVDFPVSGDRLVHKGNVALSTACSRTAENSSEAIARFACLRSPSHVTSQ